MGVTLVRLSSPPAVLEVVEVVEVADPDNKVVGWNNIICSCVLSLVSKQLCPHLGDWLDGASAGDLPNDESRMLMLVSSFCSLLPCFHKKKKFLFFVNLKSVDKVEFFVWNFLLTGTTVVTTTAGQNGVMRGVPFIGMLSSTLLVNESAVGTTPEW
jgi:hypothetical protein